MNKQEIASLSVKILALYTIVNAVISTALSITPYLSEQFYAMSQGVSPQGLVEYNNTTLITQIVTLLLPVIVGVVLWNRADWLAKRMTRNNKAVQIRPSITAIELQTLAISISGLLVLLSAVPQVLVFFTMLSIPISPAPSIAAYIMQIINPILYVIIGGILLSRASRVAEFIQRSS